MRRVSVVIPAFNAAGTIHGTVASALTQTHEDTEVVVVDDGSADETAAVVRSFGERVTCITTPNQGVSKARNTGIEHSSGELIAFLDADDQWLDDKLARQIAVLEADASVDMVTTVATAVGADLEPVGELPAEQAEDPCKQLLLNSMVLGPLSSALARRDLVVALGGFDPRFSQCADWDFFLRASRAGRIRALDEPLVLYRRTADSMSSDIALLERDTFAVLDSFYASASAQPYEPVRNRAYSNHWMILSGSYLHAGRPRAALRCLANGVRLYPANARRALGIPVRQLRRRRATVAQ